MTQVPTLPFETHAPLPVDIIPGLKAHGFVFKEAEEMRKVFASYGADAWASFSESWNHLGVDRYMADGGRYRRRRHATFTLDTHGITLKPRQPHYQSRDYNTLHGGVQRWFSLVTEDTLSNPVLRAILSHCYQLAIELTPSDTRPEQWHAEMHQFRIEATEDQPGNPTPEGLHRDGVDWVWVLMVNRHNVSAGETSIHDLTLAEMGRLTLRNPMDSAFVDDHRVYHGVTPIKRVDLTRPGYRDVLVVTVRRA